MASGLTAAKRLKDLENENSRLKRLLADAELDSTLMAAVIRRPQGGLREGLRQR